MKVTDELISFNVISTCLGLFYAYRLQNDLNVNIFSHEYQ